MTVIQEFDPCRVRPLPDQPRKRFAAINELAASIAEVGQQIPGIVTPIEGDPNFDAQLVDGERRLRACQKLKRPFRAEVRAVYASADEAFVASFASNFGKQQHDCIEIAQGLARMRAAGKTVAQLAAIAGKSDCWVYQHLTLNDLHPDVQAMLIPGEGEESPALALSVAFLLVPLPHNRQIKLAKQIAKGMSMVAARRLALNERRKPLPGGAVIPPPRGRQPGVDGLASAVATFRERIGIYLDMPGADLRTVVTNAAGRTRAKLVDELASAEEDLAGLREVIETSLSTAKPAKRL